MPSSNEIDISDRKSLQSVFRLLDQHFPHSFYLWHLLKNVEKNVITREHLWPHRLFVNDPDDVKCVLFVYSTMGFAPDFQAPSADSELVESQVTCFGIVEVDHLLIDLIEQHVPWSKTNKIIFFGNEHRFSAIINDFIQSKNIGHHVRSTFHMMELDRDVFEERIKSQTSPLPADITIRPLSVLDAVIMNESWTYRSALSLAQIQYEVEHLPALGAFRDGQLLSWCITKYDGTIGTVFTKPEGRGLGLASKLTMLVASKLFERQERVFCYVAVDNVPSMSMVEKLGYRRVCELDWIVLKLNLTKLPLK